VSGLLAFGLGGPARGVDFRARAAAWALDPVARTWETLRALPQAAPGRRDRILTSLWVAVSVTATFYAVVGIYAGLAQQDLGADRASVSCEYRLDLARDRLIALFDRSPQRWAGHDEHAAADLTNLLRETLALCAGSDAEIGRRLDRLSSLHRDFTERSRRHADARQELLAL
jgi:hypothetical protein